MDFYTGSGIRYTIDDSVPNKTILNTLKDILNNGVETYNSQLENELHESVEELEGKINDNRGGIELVNQRVDQTNASVEDNTSAISSLDMRVTSLESGAEATGEDLNAVKVKLSNLDDHTPSGTAASDRSVLQAYLVSAALAPSNTSQPTPFQQYVTDVSTAPKSNDTLNSALQKYVRNTNTKLNNLADLDPRTAPSQYTLQSLIKSAWESPDVVASANRTAMQTYTLNAALSPQSDTVILTPFQTYVKNASDSPANVAEANRTNLQNWADNQVTSINTELDSQDARITALEDKPAPTFTQRQRGSIYPFLSAQARSFIDSGVTTTYYYKGNGDDASSSTADYSVQFQGFRNCWVNVMNYTAQTVTTTVEAVISIAGQKSKVNVTPYILMIGNVAPGITFPAVSANGSGVTLDIPNGLTIAPYTSLNANSLTALGNNFAYTASGASTHIVLWVCTFNPPPGPQYRILTQSNGTYYALSNYASFNI